ncbi:carbohydrate kinase family protein [Candidatus Babeliales bacterium]|nr:carbohydrate kinase family protein [Candidatus Babeliales bacterium]
MKKVLTIGGATQDIYLHYHGADYFSITKKDYTKNYMIFESGEKIEVEKILYFTGGGSTNSAVSFKRMGFETNCFCQIGDDDAGKLILKDLKKENVDTSNIVTTKEHSSGTSFIIHSLKKERTIFAYRGANGFLKSKDIPYDKIKESDQIYITSLSHGSADFLPQISEFAHKNNVPIAINPGISQLAKGQSQLKNSLKFIDILIMNNSEAQTFMVTLIESEPRFKKVLESSQKTINIKNDNAEKPYLLQTPFLYENIYFSIRKFFREVLKMGPKIVVITNGANGVYVGTKDEIMFQPSIKTEIEDTLGAGDSFGSCFVASLMHNYSISESLINGIINSSSVIGKMGAKPGLLTHKQLKEKINKIKANKIQKFEPSKC